MILLTATLGIMLIGSFFGIKHLMNRNEMSTRYKVLTRQQDKIKLYEEITDNLLKQCMEDKVEKKRLQVALSSANYRHREAKKDIKRQGSILKGLQDKEDAIKRNKAR